MVGGVFGDAQLNGLMDIAERDAPSLQAAQSRLQEAEAASGTIAANLLPSINGTASANADHFPGHDTYPDSYADKYGNDGEVGADLAHHLDFWGKLHEAATTANSRTQAMGFEAVDAKLVLETSLAFAYAKLDAAYRLRDMAIQVTVG